MAITKWKNQECPDNVINELSNYFRVDADIVDGLIKTLILYPPYFPKGIKIQAQWDNIKIATRVPLRKETKYILSWYILGLTYTKDFSSEEEASEWETSFKAEFINPPDVVITEETIDVYED